jgi:hypothetical protein
VVRRQARIGAQNQIGLPDLKIEPDVHYTFLHECSILREMNKIFMQLAAILLLPCLMMATATASPISMQMGEYPNSARFNSEALALRDLSFTKSVLPAAAGILTFVVLIHKYPEFAMSVPLIGTFFVRSSYSRKENVDFAKLAEVVFRLPEHERANSQNVQKLFEDENLKLNPTEQLILEKLCYVEAGLTALDGEPVSRERIKNISIAFSKLAAFNNREYSLPTILEVVRKYVPSSTRNDPMILPEITSRNLPASPSLGGPGGLAGAS